MDLESYSTDPAVIGQNSFHGYYFAQNRYNSTHAQGTLLFADFWLTMLLWLVENLPKDFISFAIFLHIESPSQTVFLSLDLFNLKICRLTAL